METRFSFEKVSVSWTKYDIVRIPDLVKDQEVLYSYYSGKSMMDPSVLKAALLINDFSDPLPSFWKTVLQWEPTVRSCFMFFLFLFSNARIARSFADRYSKGPFRGVFHLDEDATTGVHKEQTNIRSLLVVCDVSSPINRRDVDVPFDGSILLNEVEAGPVFKLALNAYFIKNSVHYSPADFDALCDLNGFHRILGFNLNEFHGWMNGKAVQPSCLKSFSSGGFLCFDQPLQLSFLESKEIYLVGENGDGKTLLLMAIFAACRGYQVKKTCDAAYIGSLASFMEKTKASELVAVDNWDRTYRLDNAPSFDNLFAYGVHRGRYSPPSDSKSFEQYGFMTLFDLDLTLRDPVDWLTKSTIENPGHEELSFLNLQKVLTEVLEHKIEITQKDAQLCFIEKGAELSFGELSEGYRSTLIFLCDLLIRLSANCPDGKDVFLQSGVVLVDEICLHLHPKWQLTIVQKLRRLFPNIQFIMTTHSPVILLGAGEDAIFYKVIRESGHTSVSAPYFRRDWDGQMLNTLATSSLFGLESAAMVGSNGNVDTSESFMMSIIGAKVAARLEEDRSLGRMHFTKAQIDGMVDEVFKEIGIND